MSETRKQRTPEQLIAETQAKLEKLKIRQAKQDAKSNPALAPLFDELEGHNKTIREAKKGLGTSPQSFDARIAKHEIWIDKIEGERALAEMLLAQAEIDKKELQDLITDKINSLNSPDSNTLNASN